MCRWASASVTFATTVVGPVASMRLMSACTSDGPTLEMKSRCTPTSGSPRSWNPQEARKSASVIPAKAGTQPGRPRACLDWIPLSRGMTLDDNVHQPSRHDDHLLRPRFADVLPHRLVRERRLLDLFPRS